MNKNQVIKKVNDFVRKKMSGEETGHDWHHIDRVRKMALKIAKAEKKGDLFVIELAALTHDLDDWKFKKSNSTDVRKLLLNFGVNENTVNQVLEITENISFKFGTNKYKMQTWDGKIAQDADRLDAIGAIGIARVFAFGGKYGREIHEPNKPITKRRNLKNIKWATNTTIHHFYEKLLIVKDNLHTKTAKKIASQRHKFMEGFLKQFYSEWDLRK